MYMVTFLVYDLVGLSLSGKQLS